MCATVLSYTPPFLLLSVFSLHLLTSLLAGCMTLTVAQINKQLLISEQSFDCAEGVELLFFGVM